MKILFITVLFFFPLSVHANCLLLPPREAKIRVISCKELKAGEIFIYGEIVELTATKKLENESLRELLPKNKQKYRFYKGLSPLKRNWLGKLEAREATFCDSLKPDSLLSGIITRPCCDANYAWCNPDSKVDFMIDEHKGPTF